MSKDEPQADRWQKVQEEVAKEEIQEALAEAAPEKQGDGGLMEQLRAELAQAQKQADENRDKAILCMADMDNLRKRVQRDIENAHKYSLEKFVKELLPVIDSLEMSLQGVSAENSTPVTEGVKLTLNMLLKAVGNFGVKQINPLGEVFDPHFHEALGHQVDANLAANSVVFVMQKGYVLQDRSIRPALVTISKLE